MAAYEFGSRELFSPARLPIAFPSTARGLAARSWARVYVINRRATRYPIHALE
jgi:hypothetical protein